ncbi:MAG: preprotein translocase subunit SecA [Chloroflexi bacterium]|nr:MAG: preprotein translocase subunit SecA [Chloroflexota bacterium]TMB96635.1 MAG: preprotein translocase subunit SecA [Chloroflexota bacterium]TMC30955.1 MAG: preprotein translocase subunit SecA [Chloroflexota bacterium]
MAVLKLFDSNEGELRRLRKIAARVNALEASTKSLSDEELRRRTEVFRERLAKGEDLDNVLPEAFAAVREAARRTIGQRHFDVQLLGGMALHKGHIAEMKTGEGKTLVASLALYLNALSGEGAHLVTTNDYLAKTGAGWMGPIYHALGMSVAYIAHDKSAIYDPAVELDAVDPRHRHWRDVTRREAYLADITYGQNSEFGFDYLRDNMIDDLANVVQRDLHYAIVDEADSILIDEARTPLIISSPAEDATETYYRYASVAAKLNEESDYVVDEKHRSATLTDDGITRAEHLLGIQNMYEGDVTAVHYLDNAVKAKALYLKDREYVVKDGEVVIVDEFTGRLMPGRRWSDGLHQAVEAKERVKIQRETRTYATITIQNYFRMYDKLAGMTGTAATEAEEIYKVYKLEVTVIPTNKPMVRKDDPDLVYKTEQGKWDALVRDVKERNTRGQPVLIGTTSVDKSQRLSDELRRHGLKHEVLNAKNHEREALIIAGAGQQGAITVSTNMAGRGVDILLGEGVKELGGLHVIGTERHEARRIDNQLRGRSGRQGDPGNTRFYNSLEDDLIRIFASDRIAGLMTRLGFDDAAPIESGMVTGAITQAQIKVETRNFDIRKRALEFDDVLNNQRNVIYSERRKILEKGDVHETVLGYLHDEAAGIVDAEATSTDAEDWDVEKIAQLLGALLGRADLTKKDFGEITSQDALGDRVAQLVDETYEKREQELGPEISRAVERWVMLRTIDTHWIEHLTAMEELREGIYLRGYGQQDPLVAYKREAHDFFEQMRARIAGGVAQTIMRVSVRTAEQAEQEEQQKNTTSTSGNGKSATGRTDLRTNRDAPGGNGQTTQTGGPQKLGRNDPCWCGSGKKFKKCHGR